MMVDDERRYRAVQSRDARFDGKFFTGVVTTGIYCRPVCPAKTPHKQNVRFFSCAAAAEEAGFRPCKRCRPETAPGTPVWNGTITSVARGARLINEGFLGTRSVEELASVLGIGSRHLRRLFLRHLGVSPKALDRSRRTHNASMLLSDTDLPVATIGLEAGFRSIRQFNDAFKRSFGVSPSEVRRRSPARSTLGDTSAELQLAYRPPFDWESMLEFYSKRSISGVENVSGSTYRRSYAVQALQGAAEGTVEIFPAGNCLTVRVTGPPIGLSQVATQVRATFDLGSDPLVISEHLSADPLISALARNHPGARIPGSWDPFEAAVRAVVGQQISVKAAVGLLGEIVRLCGTRLDAPRGSIGFLFPTPQQLSSADLSSVGMPGARRKALESVANAWTSVQENRYRGLEELTEALCSIPGVGPWTAQYTALRGFLEPDAIPVTDLGIRAAVGRLLGLGGPATAQEVATRSKQWRPWRGYAAVLLWGSL